MIIQELYTKNSLESDINELKSRKNAISPARVANIVTKYFVNYVLDQNGKESVDYETAKGVFESVCMISESQCH